MEHATGPRENALWHIAFQNEAPQPAEPHGSKRSKPTKLRSFAQCCDVIGALCHRLPRSCNADTAQCPRNATRPRDSRTPCAGLRGRRVSGWGCAASRTTWRASLKPPAKTGQSRFILLTIISHISFLIAPDRRHLITPRRSRSRVKHNTIVRGRPF
jgi:hypothetical protein